MLTIPQKVLFVGILEGHTSRFFMASDHFSRTFRQINSTILRSMLQDSIELVLKLFNGLRLVRVFHEF